MNETLRHVVVCLWVGWFVWFVLEGLVGTRQPKSQVKRRRVIAMLAVGVTLLLTSFATARWA